MNKQELQLLVDLSVETRNKVKHAVADVLQEHGKPVEFDRDEGNAPCYASGAFDDDLTDVYVTKIWYENGLVKVNLYAYYLGENRENVDLGHEYDPDWEEILSCLIAKL